MAALDLIRRRVSVRTYADRGIDPSLRLALTDLGAVKAPFGNSLRFGWVEVGQDAAGKPQAPGTYGMIQGARWYLAAAVKRAPGAFLDFGFLFETLVLRATEQGLGTCWLGGTFNRGDFAAAVNLGSDEVIGAVTPVGYPSERRHLKDRVATALLRVRHRKPLEELVINPRSSPEFAPALEAVRLGPSASNKQPWRLWVDGSSVHFYLEETPGYNEAFLAKNGFQIQVLDVGIAMAHFDAVMADQGIRGHWAVEDPGLETPGPWTYQASWTKA